MSQYAKEVNEYLSKIQQGDKTQYDGLFKRVYVHLKYVAMVYLINSDFADDVVSETFLRVYKYIDAFDSSGDGYNWLCKIVQNIAVDKNIQESRAAYLEEQYRKNLELNSVNYDFSEVEIRSVIDVLDEPNRTIAYRVYLLGHTLEEVGKSYGISKVAIFKRLGKIRKILKKYYVKE